MRRMSGCRASLGTVVALLAWPVLLEADPYAERSIPLPWSDGHDVAIADFNGDGLLDVATLDSFGPFISECHPPPGPIDCGGGSRMLLTVALNAGQGQFVPATSTPAMCLPWTMVTGDFDADGRTDVMIGNRGARDAFGVCSPPSVSFYPGAGDGTFGTAQHLEIGNEPLDMVAGDFDGDGVQEVAAVLTAPGGVSLFRVAGGVLAQGPGQPFPTTFSSVAAGRLAGSGRDDIVAGSEANACFTRMRLVFPGPVLGQFATCCLPPGSTGPSTVLVGDLAAKPGLEIAMGSRDLNGPMVTVFRQSVAGDYCQSLQDVLSTRVPSGYGGQLAAADLNLDGILDLATTDGVSHVLSLPGDGSGTFRPAMPQATSGPADAIAGGDLDANGIDDLAVTGISFSATGGASVALLNQFPGPGLMLLGLEGGDLLWHGVVDALSYDLVRGDIGVLLGSAGEYSAALEACVADDVAGTLVSLPDNPPLGRAWWILGRANMPGGSGTFDEWGGSQFGPRDTGINASPLACP